MSLTRLALCIATWSVSNFVSVDGKSNEKMRKLEGMKAALDMAKTPMFKEMMANNPELKEKFKDPAFVAQMQQMLSDPKKMKEMERNPQYKAMSKKYKKEVKQVEEDQMKDDARAQQEKALRKVLEKPEVQEALKDPAVIDIMTKKQGIENLKANFKGLSDAQIAEFLKAIQIDWRLGGILKLVSEQPEFAKVVLKKAKEIEEEQKKEKAKAAAEKQKKKGDSESDDDVLRVKCPVCKEVAKRAFQKRPNPNQELPDDPDGKLEAADKEELLEKMRGKLEADVDVMLQDICNVKRPIGTWINRMDIVELKKQRRLGLEEKTADGECKQECKLIQKVCSLNLKGKNEEIVLLLADNTTKADKVEKTLCAETCKKAPPTLTGWKDEDFPWKDKEKAALDKKLKEETKKMKSKEDEMMNMGIDPGNLEDFLSGELGDEFKKMTKGWDDLGSIEKEMKAQKPSKKKDTKKKKKDSGPPPPKPKWDMGFEL